MRRARRALALATTCLLGKGAVTLHAASYQWDVDGLATNGATDGSGDWMNAASTKAWYDGGTKDIRWTNKTDTAVFGNGGSGIFTVILSNNAINAGGLTFNALASPASYYIIASAANQSNSLNLSGVGAVIEVNNAGGAEISAGLAGTGGFVKTGAYELRLTHTAGTLTGVVSVQQGTLSVRSLANGGANSSLGASTSAAANLVLADGATLAHTGAANSVTDRLFTATGAVTLANNGAGTLTFTNNGAVAYGTVNQTRSITLSGTNAGDNVFTLTLGDNGTAKTSLIKSGLGKWVLTSVSAYTGTTLVNEGTLVQNGSASGSAHTVNTGATLGGAGTVGAVTLNNGGTLAPGSTGGAIGTLTVAGDLTWNGGGVVRFDLGAAGASDRLNLTGALTRGTAGTYSVDFGGTGEAGAYTLITGASASNFTADQFTYSNLRNGMSGLFSFAGSNLIFTVVPVTAVPEPQEYALAGGAFAALAAGVRRARRKMKTA